MNNYLIQIHDDKNRLIFDNMITKCLALKFCRHVIETKTKNTDTSKYTNNTFMFNVENKDNYCLLSTNIDKVTAFNIIKENYDIIEDYDIIENYDIIESKEIPENKRT